jgi:mono/diheme cytochrome c family protein
MLRRFLIAICLLAVIGLGVFWVLTRPAPLDADFAGGHVADAENGARIFHAGGCASCHAAPGSDDKLTLAGGEGFASDFGTFHAPNISPGPEGIGGWDLPGFARAVTRGVSPDGRHYYPAFPYTTYIHMEDTDVADLFAYMQTLPVSDTPSKPHDVGFPFNIRRGLGLWKLLYLDESFVMTGEMSEQVTQGRYLVEALGHCAECHTPRGPFGGLQRDAWLSGAPNPSGKGRIPNITPAGLDWSADDIAYYLESGLTPDFDSVGGTMASVVDNMSQLPEGDRAAIAAYLKALP